MCAKTLPHPSINDCRDLRGLQVSEMGKKTTPYRVYDPESLKVMGMAFDAALSALPREGTGEIPMRRELALLIIYFVDRGELDPTRLSRLALVRMKRSEDFDLSQAREVTFDISTLQTAHVMPLLRPGSRNISSPGRARDVASAVKTRSTRCTISGSHCFGLVHGP
jgi:hypothetical protein